MDANQKSQLLALATKFSSMICGYMSDAAGGGDIGTRLGCTLAGFTSFTAFWEEGDAKPSIYSTQTSTKNRYDFDSAICLLAVRRVAHRVHKYPTYIIANLGKPYLKPVLQQFILEAGFTIIAEMEGAHAEQNNGNPYKSFLYGAPTFKTDEAFLEAVEELEKRRKENESADQKGLSIAATAGNAQKDDAGTGDIPLKV